MAAMRAPDRRDARRVPGNSQPVMDSSPDPPSLKRRLALSLMSRDQQKDAVARCDGALECAVDCFPCAIESKSVKVQNTIRFHSSGSQLAVPTAIECCLLDWSSQLWRSDSWSGLRNSSPRRDRSRDLFGL